MSHRRKRKDEKKLSTSTPKPQNSDAKLLHQQTMKFRNKIRDNNKKDLLSKISGLQLLPANQDHLFGLLIALEAVCVQPKSGKDTLRSPTLANALNKTLLSETLVGDLEDPAANPFTENIIFHQGNHVVYPGLFPGQTYILDALLESIFLTERTFSQNFTDTVAAGTICLLTLSNTIAQRAGHDRYFDGIDENSKEITVPDDAQLERLAKAVSFSRSEITDLLTPYGGGVEWLKFFICNTNDVRISGRNTNSSILSHFPVIEIDEDYVVIPTMIVNALIQFIITMGELKDETRNIALAYHDVLIRHTTGNLTLLFGGISSPDDEPAHMNQDNDIAEWTVEIDNNKMVYVQMISDDINDISTSPTTWHNAPILTKCVNKQTELEERIREHPKYCNFKLLTLRVVGTITRSCNLPEPPGMTIQFAADELHILARIGDIDKLALWKYACSLNMLAKNNVTISSVCQLDAFAVYYFNNRTFNKEERKFDLIVATPNLGRALIVKALKGFDRHAVLRDNPMRYTSVIAYSVQRTRPIYIADNPHVESFGFMVRGYLQPVWISPLESKRDSLPLTRKDQFDFLELVAHWIASVVQDLRPHLDALGQSPIEILVGTETFTDLNRLTSSLNDTDEANKSTQIPVTVQCRGNEYVSDGVDMTDALQNGTFDSCFVQYILSCIDGLLRKFGINTLTEDVCSRIVEKNLPLNTTSAVAEGPAIGRASMIGYGLQELRPVQAHDIASVTELLNAALTTRFSLGKLYERSEDTHNICNEAADQLLDALRTRMSRLSWKELMERLIEQNEAVCHIRAKRAFSVEQYVKLYDLDADVIESHMSENPRIDAVALALRTLIEISAAEHVQGNDLVSNTDLDELVAMTDQLIGWTNRSVLINKNISSPKIQLLESGRIQIIDEVVTELLQLFYTVKSREDLERAYGIEPPLPSIDTPVIDDETEQSYQDEFGLTLTDVLTFSAAMTMIGLEKGHYCYNIATLRNEITEQLGWPQEKVNTAMSTFSLYPRQKWDEPPNGYELYEVYPWRFNRRLSLLRRPIITGPGIGDERDVFFGPRQIEESIKHLAFLVHSGRYTSRDKTSRMAAMVNRINQESSDRFTDSVGKWFQDQSVFKVRTRVYIGPNGKLLSATDLGDIDVLAVDQEEGVVILAECKNPHNARNPHEIAQEIERMIGKNNEEENNTESSIGKHMKRFSYVKENLDDLLNLIGVIGPDKVLPVFITSIEIPSKYVINSPVRFISYSVLLKDGLPILRGLYRDALAQ